MSAEQFKSQTPTERIRSLWGMLVENPVETLTELNPNRTGFILTLRGRSFDGYSQEEKITVFRILFSSFSTDDLNNASSDLLKNVVFMGEEDDLSIHRAVDNEIKRRGKIH